MSKANDATVLESVLRDLAAESDQLDGWVRDLPAERWATVTTPEGWTIAHQIGHLAWTDDISYMSIAEPQAFNQFMKDAMPQTGSFVDEGANEWARLEPSVLLQRWRDGRQKLVTALRGLPADEKVAWFGPKMSPTSMATARMMETWAHARDVADALSIESPRDHRAQHVAHIGVRTRDYAYTLRGQLPPTEPFRVELAGPQGHAWTWGPADATQRVTGDGYDFALLATRRLHRDDAHVNATGSDAHYWLGIVQAFAGPPGADPLSRAECRKKGESA